MFDKQEESWDITLVNQQHFGLKVISQYCVSDQEKSHLEEMPSA